MDGWICTSSAVEIAEITRVDGFARGDGHGWGFSVVVHLIASLNADYKYIPR